MARSAKTEGAARRSRVHGATSIVMIPSTEALALGYDPVCESQPFKGPEGSKSIRKS
jgi:hypothetical protein